MIQCGDVLKWYNASLPHISHGILNIARNRLRISQFGQNKPLVRFRESSPINLFGNFSIFADNSSLMQALGVTKEEVVQAQAELESNPTTEKPTIKVHSYQEYCYFRKYKKGFESGLVMIESEAIKQNVIPPSQESVSRIFFSRSTFDNRDLTKRPPFTRANKYRTTVEALETKGGQTRRGQKRKRCDKGTILLFLQIQFQGPHILMMTNIFRKTVPG